MIAIDLRGFGWTDRPVADYSPAAQARLLKAVLDERNVNKVSIVAHSWGSLVALAVALAYPAQVDRLALYDAWVYDSQLPSMFHMARAKGLGEVLFGLFYSERYEDRLTLGFYDPDMVSQALVDDVERAFDRPGTRAAARDSARHALRRDGAEVQDHHRTHPAPLGPRGSRHASGHRGKARAATAQRAPQALRPGFSLHADTAAHGNDTEATQATPRPARMRTRMSGGVGGAQRDEPAAPRCPDSSNLHAPETVSGARDASPCIYTTRPCATRNSFGCDGR